MNEQDLIAGCLKKDRKAQKALYEFYSPKMLGVCMRYMKNREDAEDALVEGFFKVMDKIDKYHGTGSFEGWIRRVIVNQCLMMLRKRNNFNLSVEISNIEVKTDVNAADKLQAQDILGLMDLLPTGYRTVFNLYVMEGYKHREIAEMLGISINTSKSQLILAKKRLQSLLKGIQYPGVG